MHVLAKELASLEKRWDACEADLDAAKHALKNVIDFLTTDLEGHHTHAQRNGMTILIRQSCKSCLRDLELSAERRAAAGSKGSFEQDDLPF